MEERSTESLMPDETNHVDVVVDVPRPSQSAETRPKAMRSGKSGSGIRVVIFTAAYYVCDGVSLTIRKLRAHLQRKGIESRVVSCGPEGWTEEDVFTVPCIPLPIINADDNFNYSLGIKLTDDCKAKIRDFNPSIIHFTVPDFLALDALRWAKSERIPVIGTWHSNYADYLKFYLLNFIRTPVERYIRSFYVNMPIFVPTPFIRKKLMDNGFPENRVGIWGRGVDLSLFNPTNASSSLRERLRIQDDECVILWVGRLVKEKSPDIWAEVIRRLDREGLKFRALVVGAGSYEDAMKKLPRTQCLGWLTGKELADVYAAVDLFLFPSEVETFGNVTLEALASGVPCIASAGCSGHLVYHGVNGFVVHNADVDEYYDLTKKLVLDGALRERFADKARSSIMSLEHEKVMDMMVNNYDAVIREHQRSPPRDSDSGDVYITFVYYFFSFLLFLGTPILKSYVAVLGFASRACHVDLWQRCFRSLSGNSCTFMGLGASARTFCTSLTFHEKMRVLACCVYLFAILIILQTLRSVSFM